MPMTMERDQLSRVFSALADPTRRAILTRLGEGAMTVTELATPFPISLPAISRHLKVLEAAGLIARDRDAQWRRASLRGDSLREARGWLDHLTQVWEQRFDRLDAHLETLKQRQPTTDKEPQP